MSLLPIGSSHRGHFGLPLDLVTQTIAILAKKGAGKSYTASVIVEGLLDAGQVPVIVDPTGAWWGIKASADGKSPGYPMVVFGGEHADLPLEETAGEATARAIVEQRFPAIIDLSLLKKGAVRRFMVPFLETLYLLNRLPLMLVVDEADDICPQKPQPDEARMVGALEDLVKRGRKKGIGCTLITQRPADLAKQVLTQCELLVALRLMHPLDIKAVMEWVHVHADTDQAKRMVDSLPSLPIGTAWFWSPGWGDIFERVEVAKRKTFDSGATPKAGQVAVTPKRMAQADLVKIGGEIMASVQRAKENDPKGLREKIQILERKLVIAEEVAKEHELAHMDMAKVAPVAHRVDVAILTDRDQRMFAEIKDLMEQGKGVIEHADKLLVRLHEELTAKLAAMMPPKTAPFCPPFKPLKLPVRWPTSTVKASEMPQARPTQFTETGTLPEGEKRILTAVAQHPDGCTREQLTVLTGYKRSSRDTYLQRLKQREFVELGDRITGTASGIAALGQGFERLPTGSALCEYWLARLPTGEKRILEVLIQCAGSFVDRDSISQETGYQRSSRDTYIQRLSSRELVVTTREGVQASPNLF